MIKRHWIKLLFNVLHSFFLLIIAAILVFIALYFQKDIGYKLIEYLIFPVIFILINIAFIKFILGYIQYNNNLIILKNDNVIVIKTTLIDTDNIEFIDLHKITKIDTKMQGIFQNILSIGDLIIEQNRDRTRTFNYMYKPYKASKYIKDMKVNYET